jgi:hypothetical protein
MKERGYIFLCSNATEDECLEKELFGGTKQYINKVPAVKIGDRLFLYNYISGRLHGIFSAISPAGMNIIPDAWGGKFPWQVRVKRIENSDPIGKNEVKKIVRTTSNGKVDYFYPVLNSQQVEQLEKLFREKSYIPEREKSFYEEYPQKIRTDDGHWVRSYAEKAIDDWLFNQGISHGYERRIPISENMRCDFYLQLGPDKRLLYIEYWGLDDEKYRERREEKISLYKKSGLPLVQLEPRDLENLDENLTKKILQYYKDYKFY